MNEYQILDAIAVRFNDEGIKDRNISVNYKEYLKLNRKKLVINQNKTVLEDTLFKRESNRIFSQKLIPFDVFSRILFFSSGKKTGNFKRMYPSAGASYPLEVYLLNRTVNTIEKGIYHYNVKDNSLELLNNEINYQSLNGKIVKTFIDANLIIITNRINRTAKNYGLSSVQLSILEAGHLAQNICLLLTENNLSHCPVGGFDNKKISNILGLDDKEIPIYMIAFGGENES